MKFVIGPTRKAIYAHRCLLSARCEVFRAMFADQTQKHKDGEVPLVLSDMQPEIFMPMLEYIYCNAANINAKNVSCVTASTSSLHKARYFPDYLSSINASRLWYIKLVDMLKGY